MNRKMVVKCLWLPLLALSMTACWDPSDYKNIYIEPVHQSWVFPVVNSSITFKEIVERSGTNTTVETDPATGVFIIVSTDTLHIGEASDQFQLTGSSFNYNLAAPGGLIPGFGTFQASESINRAYEISAGQEIKTIYCESGEMVLDIVNNYYHPVTGMITVKSLKNNANQAYSRNFYLGGMGSNSTDNRPLNGYTIDLYNPSDQTYNIFMIQVDFTITENTSAPTYDGSLNINISFNNPGYELMTGKFNKSFSIADQFFFFSVFNSTIMAEQYFANPSLGLDFDNSYGVPLTLGFHKFETTNNQNEVIPLYNIGTLGPNDLNLSGTNIIPHMSNPNDSPAKTSFILNASNSNIDQVFKKAPNRFIFGPDFTIGDQTNNHNYFIKRNSNISFISNFNIPLNGWATTHLLGDTLMDVQWPKLSDNAWLTEDFRVTIQFRITNSLPLNIRFKAVCLNENNGVFEEGYNLVFNEEVDPIDGTVPFVYSANVNSDGIAVDPQTSSLSINLTKDEYDQIVSSPHLLFFYRLTTGGELEQSIKVLSTNAMNVQMILHFSGTINPNDFIK